MFWMPIRTMKPRHRIMAEEIRNQCTLKRRTMMILLMPLISRSPLTNILLKIVTLFKILIPKDLYYITPL